MGCSMRLRVVRNDPIFARGSTLSASMGLSASQSVQHCYPFPLCTCTFVATDFIGSPDPNPVFKNCDMAKLVYIGARPSQYDFLKSIPFYYRPQQKTRPKHFVMYAGEGIDVREIQPDQNKIPRLYYRGEHRQDVTDLSRKGFQDKLGDSLKSGDLQAVHGTMNEIMTDVFEVVATKDKHDSAGFSALESSVDVFLTSCLEDRAVLQSLATMAGDEFSLSVHGSRVSAYAAMFANYHRLSQADANPLCMAGLLGDIGKVGIPEKIILADKRLEDGSDELALLQAHPVTGADTLYAGGLDDMFTLAGVREHHERQDGSGYPQGMAEFTAKNGVKIGEVIAIADCLDYLAHDHRPYRAAVGVSGALSILKKEADERKFDPEVHNAIVQGIAGLRKAKVRKS